VDSTNSENTLAGSVASSDFSWEKPWATTDAQDGCRRRSIGLRPRNLYPSLQMYTIAAARSRGFLEGVCKSLHIHPLGRRQRCRETTDPAGVFPHPVAPRVREPPLAGIPSGLIRS